jgi:heme/copper-type cytochrome/quinol oxidase subunit 4
MKTFFENDTITPVMQERITEEENKEQEGKVIKNKYVSFLVFFGIVIFFAVIGYLTSSNTELVIAAILALLLTLALIQTLIQRRVANMMNTKINNLQQTVAATAISEESKTTLTKPLGVPPFLLDVYEQNELPDHSYTLNPNLTEEKNIFNCKPLRIFYFFNFYSSRSLINKTSGGFHRHGPVFFLGSPQDISFSKFWNMFSIKKIVSRLLLTTPEKLAEAMDQVSEKPLPPKTKGLMTENYFTGAYPSNVFYCTDAIWQQCVALLFAKTDFSIIDASDYTNERAGLQWEIGQIINHIATEDFVVLINSKSDLVALGESFKKSWEEMDGNSPNSRQHAGPVRFIFHQRPDHLMGEKTHSSVLYEAYHHEALSNDNIIALLLQSGKDRHEGK